jgi:hypothetical protein
LLLTEKRLAVTSKIHADDREIRPSQRRSGGRFAWLALVADYPLRGGARASMVKRTL